MCVESSQLPVSSPVHAGINFALWVLNNWDEKVKVSSDMSSRSCLVWEIITCSSETSANKHLFSVSDLCDLCLRVSSCFPPAWRGTSPTCSSCGVTSSTGVFSKLHLMTPTYQNFTGLRNKVLSLNDYLVAPTLMMRSASECWWWCQRRSWPMGSPTPVTYTPWPVQAVTWLQRETCRRRSVGWNRWDEVWILSDPS